MRTRREGFTLVELVICIAAVAMITLSTTTVLLMGMRMERGAGTDAAEQNDTRLFAAMLDDVEGIALQDEEGNWIPIPETAASDITDEEAEDTEEGTPPVLPLTFPADPDASDPPSGFALVTASNNPFLLFTYENGKGRFYLPATDTVLLGEIVKCTVMVEDSLLTVTAINTDNTIYNFSVYCRVGVTAEPEIENP